MQTKAVIALFIAAVGAVLAQQASEVQVPVKRILKPGEVQMRRSGGFVTRMAPGKSFLFADARRDGTANNDTLLNEMRMFCEIPFSWQKVDLAEKCPLKFAKELLLDDKTGAIVIIRDGSVDEPVLTSFPEDAIAVVNVTPIKKGVSDTVFADRLEKELWRAVAFAAGGVESTSPHCSLKCIKTPTDLDALDCKMLSPEVTCRITRNAAKFGFGRNVTTTYRNACIEGWAPTPTNDYQKAIWKKVEAMKAATNAPAAK